uniref:Uncharacterized protein n=1 Tax=Oryza sativa subsp. japonica TaxID=39947 RepID=Q6ZIW3_ORYSJ|nr:hypothetical protein [Oryza sativa Japonica Group]
MRVDAARPRAVMGSALGHALRANVGTCGLVVGGAQVDTRAAHGWSAIGIGDPVANDGQSVEAGGAA